MTDRERTQAMVIQAQAALIENQANVIRSLQELVEQYGELLNEKETEIEQLKKQLQVSRMIDEARIKTLENVLEQYTKVTERLCQG